MNVMARYSAYYFTTFVDDYTQRRLVYLISHNRSIGCFRHFLNLIENKKDKTLEVLQTDWGQEYFSNSIKELCKSEGNIGQLAISDTP